MTAYVVLGASVAFVVSSVELLTLKETRLLEVVAAEPLFSFIAMASTTLLLALAGRVLVSERDDFESPDGSRRSAAPSSKKRDEMNPPSENVRGGTWIFIPPTKRGPHSFAYDSEAKTYPFDASFDASTNVNPRDALSRHCLLQNSSRVPQGTSTGKLEAATARLVDLQSDVGSTPSDYGGPLFLLPGFVIACYVTDVDLSIAKRVEMTKYVLNHQNPDGGWGTHIEGESTLFGSCLNYVALRLLGETSSEAVPSRNARKFLSANGSALRAPQWCKLWLSILGVFEWRGVQPLPPELWLLPNWSPFHPGKLWCHARLVCASMTYLFGVKYVYAKSETDPLIAALRVELYDAPYAELDFVAFRENVHPNDVHRPSSLIMTIGNRLLYRTLETSAFQRWFPTLRVAALKFTSEFIVYEDETTDYVDIGPVNKALNLVATHHQLLTSTTSLEAEENETRFQKHAAKLERYLWVSEDGMKVQGYINSQVWDAEFSLLAATEVLNGIESKANDNDDDDAVVFVPQEESTGRKELHKFATRSVEFIRLNQVTVDIDTLTTSKTRRRRQFYRDDPRGGWGFGTNENTYVVSDCAAEAIKSLLAYATHTRIAMSSEETKTITDGVDFLLRMRNADDGVWASYEKRRMGAWAEALNPEVAFGDICVDYSYVECTSACTQALVQYASYVNQFGTSEMRAHRSSVSHDIQVALNAAKAFLLSRQNEDGSWFGSWAVCFTYATWFGCCGLSALELHEHDPRLDAALERAYAFLLATQQTDGGWYESVVSCSTKRPTPPNVHPSNVIQTAWATLALLTRTSTPSANETDAIRKALMFLKSSVQDDGELPTQNIVGVFNKTCGISYSLYKNYFVVWALAKGQRLYE